MKMKIRFYLDTDQKDKVEMSKIVQSFEEKPDGSRIFGGTQVYGIRFQKDDHGIYTETDHFLDGMPEIVRKANLPFRMVTLYDESYTGNPAQGMYEVEGAKAIVDGYADWHSTNMGDQIREVTWRIRVQGTSLEPVIDLYRKFRSGQIEPSEPWLDISPSERVRCEEMETTMRDMLDTLRGTRESSSPEFSSSN